MFLKRKYIDNLRERSNYFHKGILVCDLLMKPYSTIVYDSYKLHSLSVINILKKAFKTFDFSDFSSQFKKYNTVVTLQVNRLDYLELLKLYTNNINNCSEPYCFENILEKRYISLRNIIEGVCFFLKMVGIIEGYKNNLYVSVMYINYLNQISSLEKSFKLIEIKNKTYIPFNSAFDIENLCTQYLNNKECKTVHISHGLNYINYKSDESYDYVNGLCISGNEVLVWGESSKKNLLDNYFCQKLIKVTGNPKYPFKQISVSLKFTNCIVFLARPAFDEYNNCLLNLVCKISRISKIKFSIKAHPFSNVKNIEKVCINYNINLVSNKVTIHDLMSSKEFDFSITYNTTVYFESLYYDLLSLRYALGENEDFDGLDDKFSSIDEFQEKILKFKMMNQNMLNDSIEKLLIYNLGMGISEYSNI